MYIVILFSDKFGSIVAICERKIQYITFIMTDFLLVFHVVLVAAVVNRDVLAATLTKQHEELTDKVKSLDLDKVVFDVQIYLGKPL